MIQRIQSVYLGITIILLSIVTLGSPFYTFVGEEFRYAFSSYGIQKYDLENQLVSTTNFPIYLGLIALIMLCLITLFSYKNLKKQFKLGRTIFGIYFMMLLSLIAFAYLGENFLPGGDYKREMGLGFLFFVLGFPFTFLANIGIKRDKNLLESIDRLR